MSTVLWTHLLENGIVRTDDNDKFALNAFADELDRISTTLGLGSFLELCDDTDIRFNMEDLELPDGMESTVEWMARDGRWTSAANGTRLLEGLLAHLRDATPRIGSDEDREGVITELEEALAFARTAEGPDAKFNFSIIM